MFSSSATDFLEAARPKGKRKGKWAKAAETLAEHIQTSPVRKFLKKTPRLGIRKSKGGHKKERQQRDVHWLEKVDFEDHKGKYILQNWDDQEASINMQTFNVSPHLTLDMDDFTTFDNTQDTRHVIAFEQQTGQFIFGKVAPRQSRECLGNKTKLNKVRKEFEQVMKVKPNVGRGDCRGGKNKAYKIFGWRKDPLGSSISQYSFKPKVNEDVKEDINQNIQQLCSKLEMASQRLSLCLKETIEYEELAEKAQVPSFTKTGNATAICIGQDYWSKVHTDLDFYLTSLSCLSNRSDHHNDIIYYFIFPGFKAAVPMRSGDVLLFNPHILHSCSNPRHLGDYIFSAYVSRKTVFTKAAETFNVNH